MIGYSALRAADLLPVAATGLRTRRVRTVLSVLGIAIGIAAIVAVLGVARSSQSALLARIDALGTNLLTVDSGRTLSGDAAELPVTAPATIGRTPGVEHVAATAGLPGVRIYRSDRIPAYRSNGLAARACDAALLTTLDARLAAGVFINPATARYPVAVLGHDAAQQLGVTRSGTRIWLGGRWFAVAGILRPIGLASDVDSAALIGFPAAVRYFGYEGHPTRVYVRARTDDTAAVSAALARAADPIHPETAAVSRPSDALVARLTVAAAGTSLFLALGAVALLVAAIGIGNVMVISVLERRPEIGLRRALGAARRHVAAQFLVESMLLAGLGGLAGVAAGTLTTYAVAAQQHWQPVVPAAAMAAGLGAALLVGALAGLYPARRAAALAPTDALRS